MTVPTQSVRRGGHRRGCPNRSCPRVDFSDALPFKIEGGYCKLIQLTKGQYAIVDAEDYSTISKFLWNAGYSKNGNCYYALRRFLRGDGTLETISMHRQILGLSRGDGKLGDHRNGNTLDYRRANLRQATLTENIWNQKRHSNNTSGYRGVLWRKDRQRWIAQVRVNGKTRTVGSFTDPILAARAAKDARAKYHGEFARS